jgi:hypothetical protein
VFDAEGQQKIDLCGLVKYHICTKRRRLFAGHRRDVKKVEAIFRRGEDE